MDFSKEEIPVIRVRGGKGFRDFTIFFRVEKYSRYFPYKEEKVLIGSHPFGGLLDRLPVRASGVSPTQVMGDG